MKFFKKEEDKDVQLEQSNERTTVEIAEMLGFIQKTLFENPEYLNRQDEIQNTLDSAMAGKIESIKEAKEILRDILKKSNKIIIEKNLEESVDILFAKLWGLGPVDKYYHRKDVVEIRCNTPNKIYIKFLGGKKIKLASHEVFENDEELSTIIKRMYMSDTGSTLDMSTGKIESVRPDGTRLTATCPPITKTWTFTLRKHDAFMPTIDNYIAFKTLDKLVWSIIEILGKGRANILYSGNVEAGKTTLMRKVAGEVLPEDLRILVLSEDLETLMNELYDKDIIELEAHPEIKADMKALLKLALREGPDAIMVEEFRGSGEASEAIKACTKGMYGSMASAHFNSPEEAVEGTAMFILEEGIPITLADAKLRVARAFNIVIQLRGDSLTGIKKVTCIKEIYVDENDKVQFKELVKWVPTTDRYFGEGRWEQIEQPSLELLKHLLISVTRDELEALGWDTGAIRYGQ